MAKTNELSIEKRGKIQVFHEQGKSQVDIAKTVKCSRRCVQYTIQRFSQTSSHKDRPRSGRKRITTDRQDRILTRESLKNRKKTSLVLAAELSEQINRPISTRTVRRRLQEVGLNGRKARKKPWLSDKNKKARYKWALKYKSFTEEDWSNIVWSDESNFEIFGTPGVTFVRRRVGEEFNQECVVPTLKHGGGSVMVWGCMSASGVGEMFVCEGRMDATKYINVLENALLPSFTALYGDTNMNGVKFQQDNAPCHKAARTMAWFRENCIELLDWPAQSPDLNPIEHLWGLLKRKIRRHTFLKRRLREEWNALTYEECTCTIFT
ncbi:unnamed protein product [Acanthoscelides obtectus]|uniref:Transposase n=1 Tax=Acanthoscelides obtectus TaxID=200917 RepID=A0A9P0KNB4_ACAOB|nr:unnamed protein product [Acanthoscelides obtectus]CAK1641896.1 hypothetical protein AOBTE_LOCUS12704 [Acanthoscelides obtectus]